MFKNFKIGMKLTVAFSVVILFLLLLSFISVRNVNVIYEQVKGYAEMTLPNSNELWKVRRNYVSTERYLFQAISKDSMEESKAMFEKAASEESLIFEAFSKFKENTRQDPEMLENTENLLKEITPIREKIADLALNVSDEEAVNVLENEYAAKSDEVVKMILSITDAQNQRAEEQASTALKTKNRSMATVLIMSILSIIFATIIGIIITRSIVKPISEVETVAKEMADGNLKSTILYESKDEVGLLAESMRSSMGTLKTYINDISRVTSEMANGNFDIVPSQPYVGDFKVIQDSLEKLIFQMSSTLSQISTASDQVSIGAEQVSSSAQALAQGATEQASASEELASAINEITSKVNQNAQNSIKANEMANKSTIAITNSNEQMQTLVSAMNDINNKSGEISKIIKTIEDIAFQTNILALNAAVEAARAGESGKGFAVVADEVRNLAIKSSDAAKNTTSLIESSITSVNSGVKLADQTAEELIVVVNISKDTAELIAEIAKATNEQAISLSQVSTGVEQISAVVQTNSATSEESAAASEELSGQANFMRDLISGFKIMDEKSIFESAKYAKS